MKLIVNGDDFGLTRGVTYGILEAHEKGILTSTTALTNSEWFSFAMDEAKKYPSLGIGVHLNLTIGKPLTKASSLIDPNTGMFYRRPEKLFSQAVNYEEVYQEWKAQIERFIGISSQLPDHLDSHHFVTDYNEHTKEVLNRLCREYHLPARLDGSFSFTRGFYGPTVTRKDLIHILSGNLSKDVEIMVHPGWCDLELYHKSSYSLKRVEEIDVLCSDAVKAFIKNHNIELVHY